MKYGVLVLALCLCGVLAMAATSTTNPAERLVFKDSGFSIAPLDAPRKETGQVVAMFFPDATDMIDPGVSVQAQQYAGTIEEYTALSNKQIENANWKVLANKAIKDGHVWEYTGVSQDNRMHWYAKAMSKAGMVYAVTAGATEKQWNAVGSKLKACVDSFELTGATASVKAATPAGKFVFKDSGFSIAPLDAPIKEAGKVLAMFLPRSGGFAPNVNIQIQQHAGTMEEYVAVSRKGLESGNFKVLSDKIDKGTYVLEYSGTVQGANLHFYGKAILKEGPVYIATGAATEDQWNDVAAKVKACVDSFQLTPPAAPGKAAAAKAKPAAR